MGRGMQHVHRAEGGHSREPALSDPGKPGTWARDQLADRFRPPHDHGPRTDLHRSRRAGSRDEHVFINGIGAELNRLRSTAAGVAAAFLFAGGVLGGLACGSKSGGGTTPPATFTITTNGTTLTTITGP